MQQNYEGGLPTFFMNDSDTPWKEETAMLSISIDQEAQAVPGKGNPWVLKAENVPVSLLSNEKIDQTQLLDIILIIPFSGILSW